MALNAGIKVEGLREFRRGLKKIEPELAKQFRGDLLTVAKMIAGDAAGRVPTTSGRARGSVRAGVSGDNAYVAAGSARVPYYGWLDFGSRVAISGRSRRVGPWKGSGTGPQGGRFIYPAINRNQQQIIDGARQAFENAADRALGKTT